MRDTPYAVPKEPGRWRAIALAAVVHVALLTFLWVGVNWQSETPVEVEAEIWSPQARDAAPQAPEPDPQPQPKPEPKPEPVKEPPKAEPVEPPPPKIDIALEKEKKRKELEKKQKQQAEQEREDKLKKQKAEQDRLEKEKQEKLAEQKKADQQKQAALDKKRKQDAADTQLQKKIRDDEMRRLTGAVGSGGSGQEAQSQGSGRATDPSYADKIRSKIRSNTIFNVPDGLSGNPAVEYTVELLPDGSLRGEPRLRKSSGVSGFDEAVKRAIERSQPFPADKSGRVPGSITVVHKPKDQ